MCADGNEAYIALMLTARLMICADDRKSCILARSPRVRLKRASRETRNLAEVFFQFLDHFEVALHLIHGRKWVYCAKLGPGKGGHATCAVEFHGATAQWNHRMYKS